MATTTSHVGRQAGTPTPECREHLVSVATVASEVDPELDRFVAVCAHIDCLTLDLGPVRETEAEAEADARRHVTP